jgi:tetratricopeptide (TPR) repeat protein
MQKNFDEARKSYALVLQNYNRHQDICLGARLAKARTYEVEKNFDEAISSYNEIVDYHPWSGIGLASPLYTGRLFEVRKEKEKAKEAYQRAVKHYGKLIPDAPSPELEAQAKGYLAQAYESLGEWDEAIKILQEMINAPSGVNRPLALVMLGSIYQLRLKDADKAAMYYTKLINEFPDHQLVKLAKAQLEKMGRPIPGASGSDSSK